MSNVKTPHPNVRRVISKPAKSVPVQKPSDVRSVEGSSRRKSSPQFRIQDEKPDFQIDHREWQRIEREKARIEAMQYLDNLEQPPPKRVRLHEGRVAPVTRLEPGMTEYYHEDQPPPKVVYYHQQRPAEQEYEYYEPVEEDYGDAVYMIPPRERGSPPARNNASRAEMKVCPHCGLELRKSVYYHHQRQKRKNGSCNAFMPLRFPCPECTTKFGNLDQLCAHLEQHHGKKEAAVQNVMFYTEEEFKAFRNHLEGLGGNFRMTRGTKKNKKGKVEYFRCNRTRTRPKKETYRFCDLPSEQQVVVQQRQLGKQGVKDVEEQDPDNGANKRSNRKSPTGTKTQIRTEESCTAFIVKTTLNNGEIHVRYCSHHLHEDERLRIPDAVRTRIVEMSSKHLPYPVILMVLKSEHYQYCSKDDAINRRLQTLTIQDIRQVIACHTRNPRNKRRAAAENMVALSSKSDPPEGEICKSKLNQEEQRCLKEYNDHKGDILLEVQSQERKMTCVKDSKELLKADTAHIIQMMERIKLDCKKLNFARLQKVCSRIEKIAENCETMLEFQEDEEAQAAAEKEENQAAQKADKAAKEALKKKSAYRYHNMIEPNEKEKRARLIQLLQHYPSTPRRRVQQARTAAGAKNQSEMSGNEEVAKKSDGSKANKNPSKIASDNPTKTPVKILTKNPTKPVKSVAFADETKNAASSSSPSTPAKLPIRNPITKPTSILRKKNPSLKIGDPAFTSQLSQIKKVEQILNAAKEEEAAETATPVPPVAPPSKLNAGKLKLTRNAKPSSKKEPARKEVVPPSEAAPQPSLESAPAPTKIQKPTPSSTPQKSKPTPTATPTGATTRSGRTVKRKQFD